MMLKNVFLLILFIGLGNVVSAQTNLTGTVFDFQRKTMPLEKVTVRNLTNKETTSTSAQGTFSIVAKTGDLLEFSTVGYHTDTLFLIDLKPRVIYLPSRNVDIETVNIERVKLSPYLQLKDPSAQVYKRVMTDGVRGKGNEDKAGGLILSLGYGKYRREQQRSRELEEKERYEAEITEKFTVEKIKSVLDLEDKEIKDFMDLYRPTVAEVKAQRPFNYETYIVQAYNKWLKTPVHLRKLPPLPKIEGRP